MRTFLLFLAIVCCLPLAAKTTAVTNCGVVTMSPLNANFNNFTAAFNVSYERDATESVNGVLIMMIQLTEWDPAVPPTIASPTDGDIPMWSIDDDNYATQGKIRLRGLLLSSTTQSTSPIITYGISEESGNPCFKVDESKRFLNNNQLNPCHTQVVNPYDCDEQDIDPGGNTGTGVGTEVGSIPTNNGPSISTGKPSKGGKRLTTPGLQEVRLVSANPFREALAFSVTSPTAQTATLQLFAFTGQRVAERSVPLYAGDNRVDLDNLGTLPTGTYAYRLTDEAGNTSSGMVVKQ